MKTKGVNAQKKEKEKDMGFGEMGSNTAESQRGFPAWKFPEPLLCCQPRE